MPAAALRGFTKVFKPASRCRSFSASKSSRRMNTSPRTSSTGASMRFSRLGIAPMVPTVCVTSSPVSPSPRVTARFNAPLS